MEFSLGNIQETLTGNSIPETVLAIAGIVALLIVVTYLKDKDGLTYKFMMFAGIIVGAALILISVDLYDQWSRYTSAIAIAAGFALIIRPFKDLQIAVIVALFAAALVYLFLGGLAGHEYLDVVASGYPRIAVAAVAGIFVFAAANFIQAVVRLFGTILNLWPVLFILGLVCIAEAVCVFMEYGSVYDMIKELMQSSGVFFA